jgi:beta-glucosidase
MWPKRLAALLSFVVLFFSAFAQSQKPLPYMDPSLPIQQRVDDLVSRMTLDEKAAQMISTAPGIPRLGVPAYDWWNEGPHGVARSGYATLLSAGHRQRRYLR